MASADDDGRDADAPITTVPPFQQCLSIHIRFPKALGRILQETVRATYVTHEAVTLLFCVLEEGPRVVPANNRGPVWPDTVPAGALPTFIRHPLNDRFQQSTIEQYANAILQKSVKRGSRSDPVGMPCGDGSPWQHLMKSPNQQLVLAGMTLAEGFYRAHQKESYCNCSLVESLFDVLLSPS